MATARNQVEGLYLTLAAEKITACGLEIIKTRRRVFLRKTNVTCRKCGIRSGKLYDPTCQGKNKLNECLSEASDLSGIGVANSDVAHDASYTASRR